MSSNPSIPRSYQRYQLHEKIGQGGMGEVYKAYDRLTQETVALKQVLVAAGDLQFVSKGNDTSEASLSLALEFRTLVGLRHAHIVSVLDYGFNQQKQSYFVMEYIEEARTITDYAAQKDDTTKGRILLEILQALDYLHHRGILHRDLKPDNILLTKEGQIKVMDFGLAFHLDEAVTNEQEGVAGTFTYMAPEVIVGDSPSIASDLYAVGVIAYELFVGKHPFEISNFSALVDQIIFKEPNTTMLDDGLKDLLDRLLSKKPEERYQSARELILALCDALDLSVPLESISQRESYLQAAKFVGRETEIQKLKESLNQTLSGQTISILIGGESGVGKSRLLDELRSIALIEGVQVLRGQAVAEVGLPFQAWRAIVRHLLLLTNVEDFTARILKGIVPDIAAILGREIEDPPELTGKAYQERLLLSIVDLLRTIDTPLMIILEDLHWTQEDLLPWQQILKVKEQLSNLMIVGTYRNDEYPKLPDELPDVDLIELLRLRDSAVLDLSQAMLGTAGKNPHIINFLQQESEGNIFFMIEVVRALAEQSGSLNLIDSTKLPKQILTGGMLRVLEQRLSKIPEQDRALVKFAAIAGRQLDLKLLRHYTEQNLDNWLTVCNDFAILEIQDEQWRFSHDKLREAVLQNIPEADKLQIHRAVAESIETVYPQNVDYNASLLQHWHQAGNFDKEMDYLEPVARQLIEVVASHEEARDLLERGLQRLPDDDPRRIMLWNLQARSYDLQSSYDEAALHANKALDLARQVNNQPGIALSLNNLGIVAINRDEYQLAINHFQQSLAIFEALNDKANIAENLHAQGRAVYSQGDYQQAHHYLQQSQAIYQEMGNQEKLADGLNLLGVIALFQGEYKQSIDYLRQSLTIHQASGNQRGMAHGFSNLGTVALNLGDNEEAFDYYSQARPIYQEIGDKLGLAITLGNLGVVTINRAEYQQAIDYLQESLAIREVIGDQRGNAFILNNLGIVASKQGNYDQAQDYTQRSLAIRREIGDQQGVIYSLIELGYIQLDLHNKQAEVTFGEALKIAHSIQARPSILEALIAFARYHLQEGSLERSALLAGVLQQHDAHHEADERMNELMSQLEEKLGTQDFQTVLEKGMKLDLDTLIAEILAGQNNQD